MGRWSVKRLVSLLVWLLLINNTISVAQVENQYYFSFNQYYPYCNEPATPTQGYVFENSNGQSLKISGISGFFNIPGFPLSHYKMVLKFGSGPEVSTSFFPYEQGIGLVSDFFFINQTSYTCELKGTNTGKIDDPVYINTLLIEPAIDLSSTIQYTAFAYNLFSKPVGTPYLKPVLQYAPTNGSWIDVPSAPLNPGGGAIAINPATFLKAQDLYKDLRFRILKRIGDASSSLSFGNTSEVCRFYDTVTVKISYGGNIQCQYSSFSLEGGYKHFPESSPDAQMEVKLASEPETAWRTISKVLTDSITLFYSDIRADNSWLGKEIYLRPYRIFNSKKICGHPINFMFLPEMKVSFSAIAPKCHQGTDGQIRFDFPSLTNLGGKSVPIWITIYKYDKYPLADTGVFYKPVYLNGEIFYFNSGLTIQTSITQNYYILKSGTYNSQPYLLSAGIYKIKAGFADSAFCIKEFQFRLYDPPELLSSLTSAFNWGKPPLTYQIRTGENAATARFTITGGTKPYSYQQYGQSYTLPAGDSTGILNLLPGSNTIPFFDAHGCTTSNTLVIQKPVDISIQNIATLPVKCHLTTIGDHANGQINFTISGGVPPYKAILYRAGIPINTQFNLNSGVVNTITGSLINLNSQYQLYITDTTVNLTSPYIKKTSLLSVEQPDQLTPAIEIIPPLCFDEKAELSISVAGGTGAKEISIGNSGFNSDHSFMLEPGMNYSITIRDDNLCSITFSAEIPPAPTKLSCISKIQVPTCSEASNGLIDLTPSGGSPFEGNLYQIFLPQLSGIPEKTNRMIQSGLRTGNIAYAIQDKNGCIFEDTVNLSVSKNPPSFQTLITTHESCPGRINGSVSLTINPGERPAPPYSYALFDSINSKVFEATTNLTVLEKFGLPSGKYYLEFSDQDNCADDTILEISLHPSQLKASEPVVKNASCPGTSTGAVSLSALGGISLNNRYYFILFDSLKNQLMVEHGKSFNKNTLSEGYYSIRVQDDSSCSVTEQFRIISTDGIEYSANKGFVRTKGLPEGSATFDIRKGNGLFMYKLLQLDNSISDSVMATGFTNRIIYFDSLYGGKYLLAVMDTAGCLYNGSPWLKIPFEIKEPESPLLIQFQDLHPPTCHGTSDAKFSLFATGGWGNEYLYSIDSIIYSPLNLFSNLPAGMYRAYVRDTANAAATATLIIREPDSLVTALDTILAPNCYGDAFGQIRLIISGGTLPYVVSSDSLIWMEGTVIDSVPEGLQQIYIKDQNLCQVKLAALMPSPTEIKIRSQLVTNASCQTTDGSIRLSITGGKPAYNFSWLRDSIPLAGDSLLENLSSGEYQLRISDSPGCTRHFSFFVSDSSSLRVANFKSTGVSCYGFSDGTALVKPDSGQPPYSYHWSGTPGEEEIRGLPAGPAILQIIDAKGCSLFYPFTISTPENLRITGLVLKDATCEGKEDGAIRLSPTGGTTPYRYLWSNGSGKTSLTNIASGTYLLSLQDANNCVLLESFTIKNLKQIKPELGSDILLCAGNNYLLNGGLYSRYQWKTDSSFLGQGAYLSVSQPGNYILEVQDEEGCLGADTLHLSLSSTSFDASLLASTTVEQGDTLILLETSWPLPDSVSWELGCAEILAATPWSRLICFKDTGIVELKITGFFSDCLDVDRKLIHVIPALPEKKTPEKISSIGEFRAFPNPVIQNLTVFVELAEETKALIRLVRIADGVLMQVKQVQGPGRFELPINVQGLASGFYSLQLVVGEQQKNITIAIK